MEVKLDPNGLSRHLAIIAQTGAGKSYLAGKILEDLLGLGATIIVLDPNSDYVQLRKVIEDERVPYRQARLTEHAGRIDLYRVPGIENRRYSEDLGGPSRPYTIRFWTWRRRTSATSPGCPRTRSAFGRQVGNTCARLRQRHVDFDPTDLARELALFAGVPLDEPDPQPASRLEAPPPHPLHPAPAAPASQGTPPPCRSPPDPETSRTATTSTPPASSWAGWARRPRTGAPGGAPMALPAGGAPRGRAVAGEEDEMRAARMALRYVKNWCRTRCGGTPTWTSTASWPPCS